MDVMTLALLHVVVIALYLARKQALGVNVTALPWVLPIYGATVAVFIAYQVRKLVQVGHRMRLRKLRADGRTSAIDPRGSFSL